MPIKNSLLRAAIASLVLGTAPSWARAQSNCGSLSPDWPNIYRLQQNYMIGAPINPTSTAIKTIKVTVHVWRHALGDNAPFPYYSMPQSAGTIAELTDLVENQTLPYFAQIDPPNHPVPGYTYPSDANIRFDVVDVRFVYNTPLYEFSYQYNMGPTLTAAAIIEDPDSEGTLHVHIVRHWGAPPQWPMVPYASNPSVGTFNGDVFIAIPASFGLPDVEPGELAQWNEEEAHELGHALGLHHLYYTPNGQLFEECNSANTAEFLFDVFGNITNPYPAYLQPPTVGCQFGMPLNCPPGNPPPGGCHNNLMHWGLPPTDNSSITGMQIGRIHRNLMVSNIAKYAWGYDPIPYTLAQSETWDFPIKFYQDIIIPAGITLNVKCELHMVPQARIVVQPGGRLVVDGGRIQAAKFASERWRGIQLNGNPNLPQSYANQGVVELLNGAVIADAILGINVGGTSFTTGSGGIVRSIGSTQLPIRFVNCARAVRFHPYLQPSSVNAGTFIANHSTFTGTRFECDPAFMVFPGGAPFTEHVRLNRVVGIRFRSCTFINTRTATTSAELGHGIRSQDAHFFAIGSRFEGLDHGIHATGIQPYGWFHAQANVFKNNICGVYASQPTGCRIVGNRFVMGLREVLLTNPVEQFWFGYHRGIFMHETAKFTIQGNVLERDDDPLADEPTEGIVIGYNRDYNDVVRSNRTIELDRGFVGEGVSCSTVAGYASVIGLQFKCNECQNTPVNIWSRPDGSVQIGQQFNHSIRAHQGNLNSLADNQLDNWPAGGISTDDFRVTTSFTPIKYLHRAAAPYAPTDWSLPNMAFPWLIDPPPTNTCPIISEPPYALVPPAPQESVQHLYAGKLAYGNVRYQYDQLIDGGSTDEVVEEITATWPQDYLELRTYLLSKSPYLSVDALKQAMEKEGFPDAIRAEVCIANPEATQSDGFIKWLMTDCMQPLPEYLIGSIVASWDNRTYRSTLELQMAQHHERYSQAALALSDNLLADTVAFPLDSLIRIWQEVRTPAARYAEALALMEQGAYSAASQVISSLPVEHKLNSPELLEQQRMLAWIGFVQQLRLSGRTEAELTPAEIAQLEQLIGDAQDRPAVWIGQLLCFHYDLCRTIHTGAGDDPKRLPYNAPFIAAQSTNASLSVAPNPATAWTTLTYSIRSDAEAKTIEVRDIAGRVLHRASVSGKQGQVVWDCRKVPAGTYTAVLRGANGEALVTERAIVHP